MAKYNYNIVTAEYNDGYWDCLIRYPDGHEQRVCWVNSEYFHILLLIKLSTIIGCQKNFDRIKIELEKVIGETSRESYDNGYTDGQEE